MKTFWCTTYSKTDGYTFALNHAEINMPLRGSTLRRVAVPTLWHYNTEFCLFLVQFWACFLFITVAVVVCDTREWAGLGILPSGCPAETIVLQACQQVNDGLVPAAVCMEDKIKHTDNIRQLYAITFSPLGQLLSIEVNIFSFQGVVAVKWTRTRCIWRKESTKYQKIWMERGKKVAFTTTIQNSPQNPFQKTQAEASGVKVTWPDHWISIFEILFVEDSLKIIT